MFTTNKSCAHKHLVREFSCVVAHKVTSLKCSGLENARNGVFLSGWWAQTLILAQVQSLPVKTNSSFLFWFAVFLIAVSLPSTPRRRLWTASLQQTQATVFGVKEAHKQVFSLLSIMWNICSLHLKHLTRFVLLFVPGVPPHGCVSSSEDQQ